MKPRTIPTLCFICAAFVLLFPAGVSSQEGFAPRTIPDALRRPQGGEMPRLPRDLVIGEMGQGQAPDEAYRFARDLAAALTAGNETAEEFAGFPPSLIANHLEELSGITPLRFRIGGGRIEADGNVSFLVRFLGREESITGELFLQREEEPERWLLDDIILEEKRTLSEVRDAHRFIFSTYERFF